MYDYLIYTQLKKFVGVGKAFHMPGHKGGGEFLKKFPVADIDVTELSYSDNLACPRGVIKRAQEDIAEILGAKRSYILTDGSTSGVLSMLFAASKRGKKIIVPRNCHQSVWNACKIFGLEPIIVKGDTESGIILPPDPELICGMILNDRDIAGLIVTSPDYYGNIAPLEQYAKILKAHGRLLMVDGAHGAHLAFAPDKMGYAGQFADVWVDGAHKCLPTLTQGAILNLNDTSLVSDIEEGLSIFRTSSPSYPIMASVEYGVKYLANNPWLVGAAQRAAEIIRGDDRIKVYPSKDWAKLVIDCKPYGISADKVAEELEKLNTYCEFADGRYVLFYLSPMTSEGDIRALLGQLLAVLSDEKLACTYTPRNFAPVVARSCSFQYAVKEPSEWVELDRAQGRMCAQNAGLTPPCIPVCAAGEIITEAAVRALKSGATYGLCGGKIKVVKR